jgi:hypothetical protein
MRIFHHRKGRAPPATNCTASITFISEVKHTDSNVRIDDSSKSNVRRRYCRLTATAPFPSLNFQIDRGPIRCFFHSSPGSRTLLGSFMEEAAAAALTPRNHSFDRDRHLCSFGSSDRPRSLFLSFVTLTAAAALLFSFVSLTATASAVVSFTRQLDRGPCSFHSSA